MPDIILEVEDSRVRRDKEETKYKSLPSQSLHSNLGAQKPKINK